VSEHVTPSLLKRWKKDGRKITSLTAYDFPMARLLDEAGIDVILVGDSLGMVVLGLADTVGVDMETMVYHTSIVSGAVERALVVADLPFLSYHLSVSQALENAGRLLREGGSQAVKLEGFRPQLVEAMVDAGIPVVGHLGMLPQSFRLTGKYRVAGRKTAEQERLQREAEELAEAGCCAIVLECVLPEPARLISQALSIPTIGIGSGSGCDGQILVVHDMLGLTSVEQPRFVRCYAHLADTISTAAKQYIADVREGTFPSDEESYQ
jgi:3-methyl-2-oxobutanoate hydroxymethyltransferase